MAFSAPTSSIDLHAGYRVLLGDNHPLVSIGLKQILLSHFPIAAVGLSTARAELLDEVARQPWDLLILGIGSPGHSALDMLPRLRALRPELPVLVLTLYEEEQLGLHLLRAGVAGYLNKECSIEELVTAIQRVLAGGKYVSPRLAEHIALSLDVSSQRLPHQTLSNREFQVLRLLGSGQSVADIAARLALDVRTVGAFRRHILRKLNLRNTQEIMAYAIRHQLNS
jgi:two-component system, NarL family, invasion response regulator UvrY